MLIKHPPPAASISHTLRGIPLKGKVGKELSASTVGVIGTGNIGKTVVKHLSGFGCRILAYSLYEDEEVK